MTLTDFLLTAGGFVFLAIFGEGICAFAGYVTFKVITLGLVRVQEAKDQNIKFPWYGFARGSDGHLLIESQMAMLCGIVVLLGIGLLYLAWRTQTISFA